jgi:hypothetical protein
MVLPQPTQYARAVAWDVSVDSIRHTQGHGPCVRSTLTTGMRRNAAPLAPTFRSGWRTLHQPQAAAMAYIGARAGLKVENVEAAIRGSGSRRLEMPEVFPRVNGSAASGSSRNCEPMSNLHFRLWLAVVAIFSRSSERRRGSAPTTDARSLSHPDRREPRYVVTCEVFHSPYTKL